MGQNPPTKREEQMNDLRRVAFYTLSLLITLERPRLSKRRRMRAIRELRMNAVFTPPFDTYYAPGDPLCPRCGGLGRPTGYHDIVSDNDTTVDYICEDGHRFFVLDPDATETRSGWADVDPSGVVKDLHYSDTVFSDHAITGTRRRLGQPTEGV